MASWKTHVEQFLTAATATTEKAIQRYNNNRLHYKTRAKKKDVFPNPFLYKFQPPPQALLLLRLLPFLLPLLVLPRAGARPLAAEEAGGAGGAEGGRAEGLPRQGRRRQVGAGEQAGPDRGHGAPGGVLQEREGGHVNAAQALPPPGRHAQRGGEGRVPGSIIYVW